MLIAMTGSGITTLIAAGVVTLVVLITALMARKRSTYIETFEQLEHMLEEENLNGAYITIAPMQETFEGLDFMHWNLVFRIHARDNDELVVAELTLPVFCQAPLEKFDDSEALMNSPKFIESMLVAKKHKTRLKKNPMNPRVSCFIGPKAPGEFTAWKWLDDKAEELSLYV